jgi:hypothetical protein
MVEEILMRESFCSFKYKGCCLVFNIVAKLSEEKEEKSGELTFKPFCDMIKTFGNTLSMSKVY